MKEKTILMFPGQGSQYVGMAQSLIKNSYTAKEIFRSIEEIAQRPVIYVMENGPFEKLSDTTIAQLAILGHSYSVYRIMQEKEQVNYSAVMGHSLGELTALLVAGVYSFEDAVRIVAKRAELMAKAQNGSMSAVIGMSRNAIEEILSDYMNEVVVANINSPEQIVISGGLWALERVEKKLKEYGAKKVIRLAVSGAFHSPLMFEASNEFENFLKDFSFKDPEVPVITNVEAKKVYFGDELKKELVKQLISPVRWLDSVNYAYEKMKIKRFIEIGPKNVLTRLVKRTIRDAERVNIDTYEDITAYYEAHR